ncbi:transposase, partial [Escherichia coli ECA-0157]
MNKTKGCLIANFATVPICYGQRGEIRKRYREGQEDQLGALGLVTNAVVLWNTLYMQEALSWIRSNGEEIG